MVTARATPEGPTATAAARSPLVGEVDGAVPLDIGLYVEGRRIRPVAQADIGAMPPRIDPAPGWNASEGMWITAVTGSSGSSATRLVVAVRPAARRRPAMTVRTLVGAFVLLALATLAAWAGARPVAGPGTGSVPRTSAPGATALAVSLVTATTVLVSGWIALGEARLADADATRQLALIAELARARGVLEDPVATQRWLGSRVARIDAAGVRVGDDGPIPDAALDPPVRPPGFPASGTTPEGEPWLLVTAGEGRTLLLGPPVRTPPLLPLALGGSVLVLLTSIGVVRTASVQEVVPG